MAEREVAAYVIGKRYDCDECGAEQVRDEENLMVLTSWPPKYPHKCVNGHFVHLPRSYPGHDVLITSEPLPKAVRKRQPKPLGRPAVGLVGGVCDMTELVPDEPLTRPGQGASDA